MHFSSCFQQRGLKLYTSSNNINNKIIKQKTKIMSKKTLIYCMVAAASVLSFLQINVSKQEQSELTKANIEALSFNINEWWNSKDYVCVPATCWCMFVIKYQSEFGVRLMKEREQKLTDGIVLDAEIV